MVERGKLSRSPSSGLSTRPVALLDLARLYRDRYPVCQLWMICDQPQKLLQGFLFGLVCYRRPPFLVQVICPPDDAIIHSYLCLTNAQHT